jgi:hypothetical protein
MKATLFTLLAGVSFTLAALETSFADGPAVQVTCTRDHPGTCQTGYKCQKHGSSRMGYTYRCDNISSQVVARAVEDVSSPPAQPKCGETICKSGYHCASLGTGHGRYHECRKNEAHIAARSVGDISPPPTQPKCGNTICQPGYYCSGHGRNHQCLKKEAHNAARSVEDISAPPAKVKCGDAFCKPGYFCGHEGFGHGRHAVCQKEEAHIAARAVSDISAPPAKVKCGDAFCEPGYFCGHEGFGHGRHAVWQKEEAHIAVRSISSTTAQDECGEGKECPPGSFCRVVGQMTRYRHMACQKSSQGSEKLNARDVNTPQVPPPCTIGSKNECGASYICKLRDGQSCGIVGSCKGICMKKPDGQMVVRSTSDVSAPQVPPPECTPGSNNGCLAGYTCTKFPGGFQGQGYCKKNPDGKMILRSTSDILDEERCQTDGSVKCPPAYLCHKKQNGMCTVNGGCEGVCKKRLP